MSDSHTYCGVFACGRRISSRKITRIRQPKFLAHFKRHYPTTWRQVDVNSAVCDRCQIKIRRNEIKIKAKPRLSIQSQNSEEDETDSTTNSEESEQSENSEVNDMTHTCLLYTSPSPRDRTRSRMP